MGKALYRKYRSKKLGEIVGQTHITQTLANALEQGTFSHAYLFTGPRGIGKTSIARILAHEINNLEYDEDKTHLDIIEIDAASNRRIDEIRDLRDKVHIAPTSAKYKVYIIDEVHMLTKEAFNALLKTLEEPPDHVIFILATTEAHKLPETIISRTQRFTFKPVDQPTVVKHLRTIAKSEGADIHDAALELIAQHGDGSFRDSISLLDQVRGHSTTIELADVQQILGIAPEETISGILATLESGTAGELLEQLQAARNSGYQAGQLAKQIAEKLRQHIVEGASPFSPAILTNMLAKLVSVPAAYDPQAALDIALLDVVLANNQSSLQHVVKPAAAAEPTPKPKPKKQEKVVDAVLEMPVETQPEPAVLPPSPLLSLDDSAWQQILNSIKQTHNTLYSVARMASPQINGDELVLVFKFAFHQKRLNETKNKQIIADIASKAVGKPITITCVVGSGDVIAPPPAPISNPVQNNDAVSTISNIFGGAEVLE